MKKSNSWLARLNPNYVTSSRLFFGASIFLLLLNHSVVSLVACLILLSISEITDWFDGWLARRYGKVSDWGKLYDPFCDAFSHLLMYLGLLLIYPVKIFAVIVGIILFREMYMLLLRAWCSYWGIILAAQVAGKIKTVTQVVSIYALIILTLAFFLDASATIIFWLEWLANGTIFISLTMTIYSLIKYQLYVSRLWRGIK